MTGDPTAPAATPPPAVPTAIVVPGRPRRWSWAWCVPIAALILALLLAWQSYRQRGPIVTLHFEDGHGIKAGDSLRHRGIAVGTVEQVVLADQLQGVVLRVRLEHDAAALARAGSRFWIVRPQVTWQNVSGLDTVVGARYLRVDPGTGAEQWEFQGIEQPPVVVDPLANALEIQLYSPRLGGLARGAPVTYRQVPIGVVRTVGLAGDAATVDATVYIEPAYRHLVRRNSVFWTTAGLSVDVGISGLSVRMPSLQGLLGRGVAMATPPEPGPPAAHGHRFPIHDDPEEEWLTWQPALPVGHALLPVTASRPPMRRASRGREGWISRTPAHRGWLTILAPDASAGTVPGWLGPADLLVPAPDAEPEDRQLVLSGVRLELPAAPAWQGSGMALIVPAETQRRELQVTVAPWPLDKVRAAAEPEDVVIVAGDPDAASRPIDANRLAPAALPGVTGWSVEPSLSFDRSWHGAAALSRSDGKLLGLLLWHHERIVIALIPPEFSTLVRP